ncbi:MAG: DUF4276 family protein [Acidimicrobiia bacterium]
MESVPILFRRLLDDLGQWGVLIAKPFRVKRTQVVREGELERAVQQAVRARDDVAAALVLLDADDDCPARLGPELQERARQAIAHLDVEVAVVLAQREFECWLLAGKESLRGVAGIRADAVPPRDPERVRDGKGRLSENMEGRRYLAVDDQSALVAQVDLEPVRNRCPSFDKLLREFHRLVEDIT